MTPSVQAPSVASADSLERFAQQLRATNPFAVNRVARLSDAGVDVSAIHRGPYERIIALARQACESNRGVGAVLWGEAGAGKSHLLSRLAGWAGREHHASFVYLPNPLVAPDQLPRYVLKYVVSYLTGGMVGPLDRCTLFRLINAAVREALEHDGVSSPTWPNLEASYHRLIDRLATGDPAHAALIDRDVYRVLFLFFRSAHPSRQKAADGLAPLAVRWLSGDPLDPEEAARLGLRVGRAVEEGVLLADDQQVKQVVVALTQLALSRRQPFLLCFDQVENLGTDRAKALTQFLHDLLDNAGNLLVVLCGVKHDLRDLRQTHVIHEAAWRRLAQYQIDLPRIQQDEGRNILEARLERFVEPFVEVPRIKERLLQDGLFPLGSAWYDDRVKEIPEIQPGRVIDWGRERWDQQQERLAAESAADWLKTWDQWRPRRPPPPREQAIDDLVDAKIAELVARHKQEPHTLPSSAENLSGLAYALLEQCRNRPEQYDLAGLTRTAAPRKTQRPSHDFEVRKQVAPGGKQSGTGVLFVGTSSATSAAASLRRLLQASALGIPDRLLLVTEERQPLKLARAGQDYLNQLSARALPTLGRMALTFEQYAELDALQAVVGLARSGDLEVEAEPPESRTVREEEVIASHHRRGRYLAHPLLRELLGSRAAPTPNPHPNPTVTPPVDEKDLREFIMGQLSFKMGASSHEMAEWYRDFRGNKDTPPLTAEACKAAVGAVAKKLHAEGKIQATPGSDGTIYLLWR